MQRSLWRCVRDLIVLINLYLGEHEGREIHHASWRRSNEQEATLRRAPGPHRMPGGIRTLSSRRLIPQFQRARSGGQSRREDLK